MIGAAWLLLVGALAVLLASLAVSALLLVLGGARAVRLALAGGDVDGTAGIEARDPFAAVHPGVLVALGLALASLALRTIAVGHAPWSNLHEFSASFAGVALASYVVLERSLPLRRLAPLVAAVAAGLIGFALSLDNRADPLVPALQQPFLLTVHVGSAVIAYSVSLVAFAAAIGELVQRRAGDAIGLLPAAAACRDAAHRCILIAFPILTLTIVLGAVWANLAWRSPWSNDPKELAAAATWLVYGAYLHVAGRRDRLARLAPWLLVLGFGGVLFTYVGASLWFVGEHSYAAP
jgi:ABC-type transport system involved in cytochrome c biogenesis permease subunit